MLLAAADTYVVVVALPNIMGGTGLGLNQLQKATPIITGFLLGYVALLPLLGRLSDLHGRRPVFVGCLIAFAVGSVITATAHSLPVVVAGRAIQGVGGGGLVPVTLALVAELWPAERRGLPLGVIGGVQELGSVLGPLYGAAIVAAAGWRTIFWINLPLSALLAVAFARTSPGAAGGGGRRPGRFDVVGTILACLAGAAVLLALWAPPGLTDNVSIGPVYTPEVSGPTWSQFTSPLAFAAVALLGTFVAWEVWAPARVRRLVDVRRVASVSAGVDVVGALLVAGALAGVVVVFSTTDPSRQVIASSAPVVLPVAGVLAAGLVIRERRSPQPLIAPDVLAERATWGAMVVNLAVGAALMAALIDIPFFARATVDPSSQVGAAVILVRFLIAVPAGAVIGGAVCRRFSNAGTAAVGMAIAAVSFVPMASWGPESLAGADATVELVACGLGFGIAIAPINAAVLRAVRPAWHGLASALTVVARMVGMLVGLSALTAVGLHTFYRELARIGSPVTLCPAHPANCPAYDAGAQRALLGELHVVFTGAAICAGLAALLALLTLGGVAAGRSDRQSSRRGRRGDRRPAVPLRRH